MAALNGNEVFISVDGTTVACTLSDTLTVNQAVIDTTTKCASSWATYTNGQKSWSISVEGVYDTTKTYEFGEFFAELISGTTCTVRFGDGGGRESGKVYWYGTAIVTSLTQSAPKDDKVTFSVELTGTGALAEATKT
jgi:predicted secreted protein